MRPSRAAYCLTCGLDSAVAMVPPNIVIFKGGGGGLSTGIEYDKNLQDGAGAPRSDLFLPVGASGTTDGNGGNLRDQSQTCPYGDSYLLCIT